MSKYNTTIGLEFHAELKTATKIFCSCPTTFAGDPNTNVCPVCLGLPGVLPVLNKKAVDLAIKAGLALNCEISRYSKFDRKNYFYPDLPKGYQVTQFPLPICRNGHITIQTSQGEKKIRINRIHLEEDAGKLVHNGDTITSSQYSLPDYNRAAVPLIEIVTEPDISSAEEAREFGEQLRLILLYAGVSDVKMEQGSLRCDVNISLSPVGSKELGTKAEIKNLNSFKAVQRAILYEEARQADILDNGGRIIQETRTFDDATGSTSSMRSKEDSHDYRYFPEPDLVPTVVDEQWIARLAAEMPEMPQARLKRLCDDYGLSAYDAGIIVATPPLALFFDQVIIHFNEPKTVANWLLGDLSRLLNASGQEIDTIPIKPEYLAQLLQEIKDNKINNNSAKIVLEEMYSSSKDPLAIIQERGFSQISDTSALEKAIANVLDAHPQPVKDYRGGKKQAMGFLLGQVMRATGGQANPQIVKELLIKELDK
ncbi:MAG: Asp-tRNA(Asn)/Glu-tRNA(Gln) amidotransferase subunit GatB [Bacillota bacterium]|jgi:aspartyl-tRNA(Asn)/glutamyl-tRNA(Gln) amidotransferase subunit B